MPWASRTNPKYGTRQHRALSAEYKRLIIAGHVLTCTAKPCLLKAGIANPNGNDPDGVTVGHADNGVDYDGPQHRKCNIDDGAKRGRARRGRAARWVV